MGNYQNLYAFQKAYKLAMLVFHGTKNFPKEEKYSLTSQIRRSTRSVCANIAEAYRRRKSKVYFISKLNDSDCENTETEVWILFSRDCGYITEETYKEWNKLNSEIGSLLFHMINNPDKYL